MEITLGSSRIDAAVVEVLGAVIVGLPSASGSGGTMPQCASRLGKELLKGI
jgi:hypothetical protein